MQLENIPFHTSSIASIIAIVVIGLIGFRAYTQNKSKAWAFLALASVFYLIDSLYGYIYGLAEYGLIRWPLNEIDTFRAYYITSFISIASEMCFVTSIALLYKEFKAKSKKAEQGTGANG